MFELYKKEIEFKSKSGNTDKLTLLPLSGDDLPVLYAVSSAFKGDSEEDIAGIFSNKAIVKDIHYIVYKTMEESYPNQDKANLDKYVSQNLMSLLPHIIKINIGKEE